MRRKNYLFILKHIRKRKRRKCRISINRFTKNESTSDGAIVLHDYHQLPNCEQARNALATGGKQNIGEVIASVIGNLIKSAYSISIIN
ncbi:hypothetical protein HMPREF3226_00110 [Prevotella corporis]|uniref:Uncharacterized protein n=1 Tax=Prevotella corporis TaxID=28128 RepID=A0A133QQT6_9BACT|nr:hypothetical protein HMPREF3226_00110 [Prevotella corporis]